MSNQTVSMNSIPANTSDSPAEPNPRYFRDLSDGFEVAPGHKAYRDPKGVWHNAIGLESTELHRHVSRIWQEKCVPFGDFIGQVTKDDRLKRDKIQETTVLRFDENLDIANFEGEALAVTRTALMQIADMAGVPYTILEFGMAEENTFFRPWAMETLNLKLSERLKSADPCLLRLRTVPAWEWAGIEEEKYGEKSKQKRTVSKPTNVLRAVFDSNHLHGHLDNVELMDYLGGCFPETGWNDALASHLVDNRDSIQGNILVPDYMKSRPDSDYGVGISFFNSEVGGGFRIAPFLFRAICLNGCIWGRRASTVKIARTKEGLDRTQLKIDIKRAVDLALTEGNDLLVQMGYIYDVPVRNVGGTIAFLCKQFGLSMEQGRRWYDGYELESLRTDTHRENAFGLFQGLTRSAQGYPTSTRLFVERKAAEILTPDLKASCDVVQKRWLEFAEAGEQVEEKKVHQIIMTSAGSR